VVNKHTATEEKRCC